MGILIILKSAGTRATFDNFREHIKLSHFATALTAVAVIVYFEWFRFIYLFILNIEASLTNVKLKKLHC